MCIRDSPQPNYACRKPPRIGTVSYTHLDVYKRQALGQALFFYFIVKFYYTSTPVSYTHLDVYKRQVTLRATPPPRTLFAGEGKQLMHNAW